MQIRSSNMDTDYMKRFGDAFLAQRLIKTKKRNIRRKKYEKFIKKHEVAKSDRKRVKVAKGDRKRVIKKRKADERKVKLNGQLMTQLVKLQERINRMNRDKELYYLVNFTKEKGKFIFEIVKKTDNKKVNIKIDTRNWETHCSCFDWKIRCKNLSIPCKHIFYLFDKMIKYELYDFYDNKIMLPDVFKDLVKKRIRLHENFDLGRKEKMKNKSCPICFLDFDFTSKTDLKKCPDCKILTHNFCAKIWLTHSDRRNCICCRSESWNMMFK